MACVVWKRITKYLLMKVSTLLQVFIFFWHEPQLSCHEQSNISNHENLPLAIPFYFVISPALSVSHVQYVHYIDQYWK